MEKYGNKSPAKKFLHRYTGFIVCGALLASTVPLILIILEDQAFFEGWSCGKINQYLLTDEDFGFVSHDELTEEDHLRLHEIYLECGGDNEIIKHDFEKR